MSGDAANTALWTGADVYIDPLMTAVAPSDVTTAWAAGWDAVGLLDGEEGFVQQRSEESSEFYAWGGTLTRKSKSKHKRTISFVALEDNATVFALVNPGSTRNTAAGVTTSTVKVPQYQDFAIGFEVRDGSKTKRRWATRASIESVEDVKESESDPTVYKVTVVLYPESDGTLYHEIEG